MTQRSYSDPILNRFPEAVKIYSPMHKGMAKSYEAFFQTDKLKQQGFESVATSDIRSTVDIAVHLLSSIAHIDRLPKSIHDDAEQQKRDKAERAVRGWWRQVEHNYVGQGRGGHQKELAAWLILTGWAVQYTGIFPGRGGKPMPVADLLDPTRCYPFWEGPYGELSSLYYIFELSGAGFKSMAQAQGISIPNAGIDDDAVVSIMDFWQEKYNKRDDDQPDVLNTLYYAEGKGESNSQSSAANWSSLRETENFSPNSSDVGSENGFENLPFRIYRPSGTPIVSSYETNASKVLELTAGGMIGPMLKEWADRNRWESILREEIRQVMVDNATKVIISPGANANMEDDERGEINQLDSETTMGRPFPRQVEVQSSINWIVNEIDRRSQKLGILNEVVGMTDRQFSGVALKAVQEGGKVHLVPHVSHMQTLYGNSGKIFLDEFKRRFADSKNSTIRVQGNDVRYGFFDEDFSVEGVPDSTYMESELRLSMPTDDMMTANIFRAYNPNAKLSLSYLREHVAGIQDLGYEREQLAADNIEQNPMYTNEAVAQEFFALARAAEAKGDIESAKIKAFVGTQILQSIMPQQGQGNAPRQGQGPSGAGGNMSNAGGGNPALSPGNQTVEPSAVAAPAGDGAMEQAIRNAGGM